MTTIAETPYSRLEAEGRLLNSVLKEATTKPGRFGFRGTLALKFQTSLADEKRPPDLVADQIITVAQAGESKIPYISAYLHSFEYLKDFVDVVGDLLTPEGKYFMFCNNIDLLAKYQVELGGANFYILPIDESTVYNETLSLLDIDKNDVKKFNTAGKTDYVADKALEFNDSFEKITFEKGLELMGPVRNRNEGRPV